MKKSKTMHHFTKLFESTGSYWNGNGKFQNEYNEMIKNMPDSYSSISLQHNILIAMANIYHDYHNNGFGNNWGDALLYLRKYASLPDKYFTFLRDYAAGNTIYMNSKTNLLMEDFADYCIEYAMRIDPRKRAPVSLHEMDYDWKHPEKYGFYVDDEDDEDDDY